MTWLVVAGGIATVLAVGVWRLRAGLRDSESEWDNWDTSVDLGSADQLVADLEADEADHVARLAPAVEFVPDGFTCLGCGVNPALPFKVWCAVCTPISVFTPLASEPIERGQR